MRICIIGCGAIGSLFAAHLACLEDVKVYAFDVAQEHVDAINKNGLRISGQRDFIAPVHATVSAEDLPRCDYGIVATKSTHTRAAIEQAARAFDDGSAVCSVQNGLGNEEILAEHVRRVIRGTTFPAGHIVGPGHVCYDIAGKTWIGPFEPTGTPFARVQELAATLTRAGLETMALQDARSAQWTKLIFNAATNPVGALSQLHHGAATFFAPTGELFEKLIREGEAVAGAMGIDLAHNPREMVLAGANAPGKHKSSMLQDVEARRPTEVDFLNGAIVREAKRVNVETPLNQALWALVKGLEHSWTNP